jgi:hypothetical protein
MLVKIDNDQVINVLVTELRSARNFLIGLRSARNFLINDWIKVRNKKEVFVFDKDPQKDLAELSKHIEAMRVVIQYYGGEL